jgi:RNA 3'-terminal phosphate cyclase (ATP)
MLKIDGSFGEGGGQILRSALALSMVTGTPFRIEKIRARRKRPGLRRQHLTAVEAAAQISKAEVTGAALGSTEVTFAPCAIEPGDYAFSMGTAGSTTLVLQTILPALLCAEAPSRLALKGGTHNPHAPPHDFLAASFLPLVNRMGPRVETQLNVPGFYPAGGGNFTVSIEPAATLSGIDLTERGDIRRRRATAIVTALPGHIVERELRVIAQRMGWPQNDLHGHVLPVLGPGNVVMLEIECEHVTEVFTGFGRRGVRAETVAATAVEACQRYLAANVAVGEHLADQLLLPLAIAGRGSFTTLPLTTHATTHIELIGKFLDTEVKVEELSKDRRLVRVVRRGAAPS